LIICSCAIVTDRDVDRAIAEIMREPRPLLPTPGVVFRHLKKKMTCCGCAPLAVSVIYASMDRLESDAHVCPYALAEARKKIASLEERRRRRIERHDHDNDDEAPQQPAARSSCLA
jgi:bacterioferritin-associated ferredoxin